MIRPFDIRDVSIIQRLSPFGCPLAYELAAVDGIYPLRDALRAYVSGGRDNVMLLVGRDPDRSLEAFGLLHMLESHEQVNEHNNTHGSHIGNHSRTIDGDSNTHGSRRAALIFMAPNPQSDELVEAWMEVARNLVAQSGARGAHHVIAEAPVYGGEAEALYGAGFAPLIHQDVLKLAALPATLGTQYVPGLREQERGDGPLIKMLQMRAVPKMVQQAEASAEQVRCVGRVECSFVLSLNNEVMGHVAVRRGRRGRSLQALFRPEVEEHARSAIQQALACLSGRVDGPIYCTVRGYQSWLLPIFDDLGFTHVTSTTLMIKHTAARVQQPVWSLATDKAAVKHGKSVS